MTNEDKANELSKRGFKDFNNPYTRVTVTHIKDCCLEMAQWKDEQLGWHDTKKEQPPMDEEVIVLTNTLNGKEFSTSRMICFAHIVDKNICVDYDGWNIPGVAYWMYYKEPK